MKKLILSLAVVAAAFGANAQAKKSSASGLKFSVGVEAAVPVGDFGDSYKFGIGGTAQGDYWVSPELALGLQSGYISFSGKEVKYTVGTTTYTAKVGTVGIIPIMAGMKYKFGTSGVYGSAQLGTGIFTGGGSSESTFAYAPGIGYSFTPNFDALLKYQAYSKNSTTLGSFGLRVAYTF